MVILKVFRAEENADFLARGVTSGAPVDLADGFIHFSTPDQIDETVRKHFEGEEHLILLACDPDTFGDALRWEPSRGGDLFPHLYEKLHADQVLWSVPLTKNPDGTVQIDHANP